MKPDRPLDAFETRLLSRLLVRFDDPQRSPSVARPARSKRAGLRRSSRVAIAALVGTAVIAGGALAADELFDQQSLSEIERQGPTAPTPAVPAALRDHFELFRSTPPISEPATKSQLYGGQNAALARTVSTEFGLVTVIPGSQLVCLHVKEPGAESSGGSCTTLTDASTGDLVGIAGSGDDRIFVGLAPDEARTVRLHHRDGSYEDVSIHQNIWATKTSVPRGFSFRDDHGEAIDGENALHRF